jgi:hypothetical protein
VQERREPERRTAGCQRFALFQAADQLPDSFGELGCGWFAGLLGICCR